MSAPTENNATSNGAAATEHFDEGFRVYVGNLPYSATEEQLRDLIKPTGTEPTSVSLPMKFNRPSGFAFLAYKDEADAKKVVEQLNGHELGERKLLFEVARTKEEVSEARKAAQEKRTAARAAKAAEKKAAKGETATSEGEAVAAKGESKASKPKKARGPRRRVPEEGEEAEEEEGAAAAQGAEAVKPKKKRSKKPKGAAAAAGEAGESAAPTGRIDAAEDGAQGGAAGEQEKKPKREKKPRGPKLVPTGEDSKNSIFVANLPFSVDDEALASIFTNLSIGVKSATVVKGLRKGKPGSRPFRSSKGYGFVEVQDPAQQAEAVKKVDGSLIGDRQISARVAHEMKPAEKEAVAEAQQEAAEATA